MAYDLVLRRSALHIVALVVRPELQPRMDQLYIVGGDFLPQQAPRGAVMHARHDQPAGQVPAAARR